LKMVTGKETRGRPPKRKAVTDPKHPTGRPCPPDWLGAEAARVFEDTCDLLAETGKLTVADSSVLTSYAALSVDWMRARKMVDDAYANDSVIIVSGRGGSQTHPSIAWLDKLERRLESLRKELCMSPAARERRSPPTTGPSEAKSKIEAFADRAKQRRGQSQPSKSHSNGRAAVAPSSRPVGPQAG
jgi:P27 family predicted phage terminase small subunit